MGRGYSGNIPSDGDFEYAGIVQGDEARFLVYSKMNYDYDGMYNGFIQLKVVLEPGKKSKKANYWLSLNESQKKLSKNHDFHKMSEHMPVLTKNIKKFIDENF